MRWSGWTDDLSGLWQYYVEVFELRPNRDKRLTERSPLKPVFNKTIDHTKSSSAYATYLPKEPGMYR